MLHKVEILVLAFYKRLFNNDNNHDLYQLFETGQEIYKIRF